MIENQIVIIPVTFVTLYLLLYCKLYYIYIEYSYKDTNSRIIIYVFYCIVCIKEILWLQRLHSHQLNFQGKKLYLCVTTC